MFRNNMKTETFTKNVRMISEKSAENTNARCKNSQFMFILDFPVIISLKNLFIS